MSMLSVTPSASASQVCKGMGQFAYPSARASLVSFSEFVAGVNVAVLEKEDLMKFVGIYQLYCEAFKDVYGSDVTESSGTSQTSVGSKEFGSSVSSLRSERRKRQRRRSRERKQREREGVVGEQVEEFGTCYLKLIHEAYHSEVRRQLGLMPSMIALLDSPTQWFDFTVFDRYRLSPSGDMTCHVGLEGDWSVRQVFASLARGCPSMGGTLAAVATHWWSNVEVPMTYETRMGRPSLSEWFASKVHMNAQDLPPMMSHFGESLGISEDESAMIVIGRAAVKAEAVSWAYVRDFRDPQFTAARMELQFVHGLQNTELAGYMDSEVLGSDRQLEPLYYLAGVSYLQQNIRKFLSSIGYLRVASL